MELPSSRFSSQQPLETQTTKEPPNMSTLTMRAPAAFLPSPRDMMWDNRASMSMSSRHRQLERVELPSIRQAVPEIDLRSAPADSERREATSYSPVRTSISEASYISSPPALNKRRRLSAEEELAESRDYSVPRIYRSPQSSASAVARSPTDRRSNAQFSTAEYSNRASPYTSSRPLPSIRASPSFEPAPRSDYRPSLPTLPSLTLERGVQQPQQQSHSQPQSQALRRRNWSEYAIDTARIGAQTYPQSSSSPFDPPHSAYSTSYAHVYQQQPRGQSYSGSSSLHHHPSMERSPFSAANFHHGQQDGHMYDMGVGAMSDVNKQRKRRGNLPKETTDTLRSWFHSHLQHPYPTEDEKQDLMRHTGLQMNQISNWFINARRRQLPAIILSAQAESAATNSGDVSVNSALTSEDQSGSEGGYDEDYVGLGPVKPGSAPTSAQPGSSVTPQASSDRAQVKHEIKRERS